LLVKRASIYKLEFHSIFNPVLPNRTLNIKIGLGYSPATNSKDKCYNWL